MSAGMPKHYHDTELTFTVKTKTVDAIKLLAASQNRNLLWMVRQILNHAAAEYSSRAAIDAAREAKV